LDDAHLLAALHYVDVNPLRAGMTAQPLNWRWSSARAHSSPQYFDEFLDWPWVEWMQRARFGVWSHAEWKECLGLEPPQAELNRMRRATTLGEPLGSDAFVQELEAKAGRRLRVLARGRPFKVAKLMSSDPFLLPQVEEA
jgi:putative transposase